MTPQAWATIAMGVIAGIVALATISQKRLADNRREWWTRLEWGLSATYSADVNQRRDGWAVVYDLISSRLATPTERGMAIHLSLVRYRDE